jgi:uncharacterized protein YgiM (DUF1202 family)
MKYLALAIGILFVTAQPARANSVAYVQCGTYDGYILLYKSTQKFEELGKLRCGEEVTVVAQTDNYSQLQTSDGRFGWVLSSDLSTTAPAPQETFTFGLTEKQKSMPAAAPPAEIPHEQPVAVRPAESAPLITNVNVMKMQGDHASPDELVAKINSSRCDFDTSPEGIHRLKLAGISDRIVLAMLHAPAAFSATSPDTTAFREATIPAGTPVEVALNGDVPAKGLQEGTIVELSVAEDVTLNGVTLVRRGAEARARIMAVRRGGLGSSGEVIWFMQDVQAATGDRIPANFAPSQHGPAAMGNFAGYPFFISDFHKNAPALAASGDHYTAVTTANITVRVPQSTDVAQAATKTKAQPVPQVMPAAATQNVFPVVVEAPAQQTSVKP